VLFSWQPNRYAVFIPEFTGKWAGVKYQTQGQFLTHSDIIGHSTRGRAETASGESGALGGEHRALCTQQIHVCLCRILVRRGHSAGIYPEAISRENNGFYREDLARVTALGQALGNQI